MIEEKCYFRLYMFNKEIALEKQIFKQKDTFGVYYFWNVVMY